MSNLIALAIPAFLALIGIELAVARRKGVRAYRLADVCVDLSCGILQQVFLVFCAGTLVGAYVLVYDRFRLFTFDASRPWAWLVAFVLVDFTYYWWHRLSHEVNFLWAAHVVHHQSEDYNLAVALRQSVTTAWTILPFHLPLALFGIPPLVFLTVDSLSTLYQFWIHTRLLGKLGWFERVFNTPAQHRVHHAINPRYLDRNYAATLCVWDRLFGTFEEEREPPVYGLVTPLDDFNPLWAQVHAFARLWRASAAAPGAADKLKVWLLPPTFHSPWLEKASRPPPPRAPGTLYDPEVGVRLSWWLFLQLALAVAATTALLFRAAQLTMLERLVAAALIVATLAAAGGLIERRAWARPLEIGRLVAVAAAASLWWAGIL